MKREQSLPGEQNQPLGTVRSRIGRLLASRFLRQPERSSARPWSTTVERLATGFDVKTIDFSDTCALDHEEVLPLNHHDITVVAYHDRQSLDSQLYSYIVNYEKPSADGVPEQHLASYQIERRKDGSHCEAQPVDLFTALDCDDDTVLFRFSPGDQLMHIPAGALRAKAESQLALDSDDYTADLQAILNACHEAVMRRVFGPPRQQ